MAHPESFYHDPAKGAAKELEIMEKKAEIKKERYQFRRRAGCAGCFYGDPIMKDIYMCNLGETPGPPGYCKEWWDIRTGKAPSSR